MGGASPSIGPVQYKNLPAGDDKVLACVQSGLYLVSDGRVPTALLVSGSRERDFFGHLGVEVMATDRATADAALAAIRGTMRKRNIYRGHVVSLRSKDHGNVHVEFHRLPEIGRDDIILPEGLLDRIERLTVKFSEHRDRLAAAKRHLKRGLLLYGPPGTGKTLTAMYLAGRMPERTTIHDGRGAGPRRTVLRDGARAAARDPDPRGRRSGSGGTDGAAEGLGPGGLPTATDVASETSRGSMVPDTVRDISSNLISLR